MTGAIKAIETRYKGYRFRSRLEARWVVFFDALGLKWEYEREGYELPSGRYLPDFFVHWMAAKSPRLLQFREVGYWVEIKGTEPTEVELAKFKELCAGTGHLGYMLVGSPDEVRVWVTTSSGECREWGRQPSQGGIYPLAWLAFVQECPSVRPSPADVVSAVALACSARFEHGESGGRA